MTSHPSFDRTQAALNAARQGDYAPAFDAFTDDVLMENGPGAGPRHRARGKDDLALLLEFASSLVETFHQDGQCVYADDRANFGTSADFPYVGTTYRLTEQFHFWTKHALINAILQPEEFVEIGEALAKEQVCKTL